MQKFDLEYLFTFVYVQEARRFRKENPIHLFLLFQNDVCVGDGTLTGSNGGLSGNCYTSQECETLGGAPAGDCAEGYGVCCVCKFLSNFQYFKKES